MFEMYIILIVSVILDLQVMQVLLMTEVLIV